MRLEVFPKFSVNIELCEFNAVDLVHGIYQVKCFFGHFTSIKIRFRFKQSYPFTYDLKCDQKPGEIDGPQVHYQTAVSRPIKIGFSEQTVDLMDIFQLSVDVHKRLDKLEPINLELQVI
jgi:hypothetical protein